MTKALSVDFEQLSWTGKYIATALEENKAVHVISPERTGLRLALAGPPFRISDGIIDEEILKIGARWTALRSSGVRSSSASGSYFIEEICTNGGM